VAGEVRIVKGVVPKKDGLLICGITSCKMKPCDVEFWGCYEVQQFKGMKVSRVAVGDGCGPCHVTWMCAHSKKMSWDEFVAKCNAEPAFDLFVKVERDRRFEPTVGPVDHARSDLTRSLEGGVRAIVRRLAVTPAVFEKRYGEPASDLGYKEKSILIPGFTRFKAIVVVDDGMWQRGDTVDLEYYALVCDNKCTFHQEKEHDVYALQSGDNWEALTAHEKDTEDMDVR